MKKEILKHNDTICPKKEIPKEGAPYARKGNAKRWGIVRPKKKY